MERSPALAKRQRERGLRVVSGDAQTLASCKPVLAALAASPACTGFGGMGSPECIARDRGTPEAGASVVLSNELLDAFAPLKVRLSLYGKVNVTNCASWQEVRLVHVLPVQELKTITEALGQSTQKFEALLHDLRTYTEAIFCGMANSTIGKEARAKVSPGASCLSIALGLGELLNHVDLGVPAASHNMRLRLRKDNKMWSRLQEIVDQLERDLHDAVVLPRDVYRQLRHQMLQVPDLEVHFLHVVSTYLYPVTIGEARCDQLSWWFEAHRSRIERLAKFYRALGYPAVHLVVRPGEKDFIDLVDCLLGPSGGFKLSIDYGATFEGLGHSLSIDPRNDGIFVPPIPHELMAGLPECHNYWPKCAGRIDWTTFVDFTNLAAAGERLGWRTLFYGPQSALEHISRHNLTVDGSEYAIPGYSVLAQSWVSRHVRNWYGREADPSQKDHGGYAQRWTSFKVLLLEKPARTSETNPILFPSWHLDHTETDSCWQYDPTTVPLADWIPRQGKEDPKLALETLTADINDELGRNYSLAYEEAQLAVRMVDWLVATGGCRSLERSRAVATLSSAGLKRQLHARLLRVWGQVWGEEAVLRIAEEVFQRLAGQQEGHAGPPACAGFQTFVALCHEPGGAGVMPWGASPRPGAPPA